MKLLLVEDERDLSKVIKRILEYSKYEVDTAFDGLEALDKLQCNTYNLIILDVMMPKMDGFSVLKQIRKSNINIPILMLTARSEIDDKVLGLDNGADDYLTKPFQVKELLARIRALLRRSSEIKESVSFENISLDFNTFELCCGDKKTRLTNKEYKLMDYLIRHQDSLCSTEKLMEAVWDFDTLAEINVVWAYISALRKKLESIGANVEIKSIRGVGYQLSKL